MKKNQIILLGALMMFSVSFCFSQSWNMIAEGAARNDATNMQSEPVSCHVTVKYQTTKQDEEVYLAYSVGELTGFDNAYPGYQTGPFRPTIPGKMIPIKHRSECSISSDVMYLNITPDIPVGDWVRGTITVTIHGLINLGVIDTWDGNAPNGVFITQDGVNDLIIRYTDTMSPLNYTFYWWIPCSSDSQRGFILYIF